MYFFIVFFFLLCIAFFIIHFYRRRWIIQKICNMNECEKLCLLHKLTKPFGFFYLPVQDIISSRSDAWQKDFGYCTLYDHTAPFFNMVFDCEPIYFDYNNQTWMIELWKGQYGINIGGEIGIYHADSVLSPDQYEQTTFYGVSDIELLPVSMKLNDRGKSLFSIHQYHWWLTGFCMGCYCEPEDLKMEVSIRFPNEKMLKCFTKSLKNLGYQPHDYCINCLRITFTFCQPHTRQPRHVHRFFARFSQWQNRILCKLYRWITQPFTCTTDRIIYLYYFFPVIFRHMLCLRKNYRQKYNRKDRLYS